MEAVNEARAKVTMSPLEQKWKKKLMNLLRDDGKGHHHKAYADRLEDFVLNIIPANEDPTFTASISFNDSIIRISSGFLTDPTTFNQLSVLLRHELAHNLMMHQIRMAKKVTDKFGDASKARIDFSMSLADLMNVIEDLEIHNTRMSEDDKKIIRGMWLNGRTIGGLLAEDSPLSSGWTSYSLEQMYDALGATVKNLQDTINNNWNSTDDHYANAEFTDASGSKKVDQIAANVNRTLFYNDTSSQTNFLGTIKDFLNDKAVYHFFPMDRQTNRGIIPALFLKTSLPEAWIEIIQALFDWTENTQVFKQNCRDIILEIAKTNSMEKYDIVDPRTKAKICDVITPEEKLIAIDTLKALIPELEGYNTWYAKVLKVLSDNKYSKQDIEKIISNL